MKVITIQPAKKLRLMIYGKPGSGKTYLCGTAGLDIRTSPVLHIDLAGNPESMSKLPTKPNTTIFQPDKLEDLDTIYDWLAADQPLDKHLAKKYQLTERFNTVIFDGFTDIQRQSFDMVMGITAETSKFTQVYPKRTYHHYNFVLQQTIHMIDLLRKLNLHIIVTALEHTKNIMEGDKIINTYASPMLDGEGKREVPGYTLGVIRMVPKATDPVVANQQKAKYTIGSFEHTTTQYGKDQHGLTKLVYGDPTITTILDAMKEG